MAPKMQRVRLKDIETSAGSPSTTYNNNPSSSVFRQASASSLPSSGSKSQSQSSFTSGPKLVKLGVGDISASKPEEPTVLRVDELSKDGRRIRRRELDISELSPVKKRREALDRSRRVVTYEPVHAPLSWTLQAVLQGFSASGFEYVPDSRALPSVESLMAAAAEKHSKRRYLSSVVCFPLLSKH